MEQEGRMIELNPCPFCGEDDMEIRVDDEGLPYIYCYGCDSVYYNDNSNDAKDLVKRWNRREI